jgi:hypothetical protein
MAARRVAAAANALLRAEGASAYERTFARQIGKIVLIAERIALDANGSDTGGALAAGQLKKIEQLLTEIVGADSLSKKRQDQWAELLRDRRHKLASALPLESVPKAGPPAANRSKGEKSGKKDRRDR